MKKSPWLFGGKKILWGVAGKGKENNAPLMA